MNTSMGRNTDREVVMQSDFGNLGNNVLQKFDETFVQNGPFDEARIDITHRPKRLSRGQVCTIDLCGEERVDDNPLVLSPLFQIFIEVGDLVYKSNFAISTPLGDGDAENCDEHFFMENYNKPYEKMIDYVYDVYGDHLHELMMEENEEEVRQIYKNKLEKIARYKRRDKSEDSVCIK